VKNVLSAIVAATTFLAGLSGGTTSLPATTRREESVIIRNTGLPATLPPPLGWCPNATSLAKTDQFDREKLVSLLPKIIPAVYSEPGHDEYSVQGVEMAARAGEYGKMAATWCGPDVANSTWVVFLCFPKFLPSASASAGQLFVAKTNGGWEVWARYH
jgi:hypothetical protein